MKPFLLTIACLFLLLACSDDSLLIETTPDLSCLDSTPEIRKNFDTCEPTFTDYICGIYDVEEINLLPEEDFGWIPMVCQDIGTEFFYKNDEGERSNIVFSGGEHFIRHERKFIQCDSSREHYHSVCQRNEVIVLNFIAEEFGTDTIEIGLERGIYSVIDEVPTDAKTRFTMRQITTDPNAPNRFHGFLTDALNFVDWNKEFYKSISLMNEEYSDVVELKWQDTSWSSPFGRIYWKKDVGILGFYRNSELWMRTN